MNSSCSFYCVSCFIGYLNAIYDGINGVYSLFCCVNSLNGFAYTSNTGDQVDDITGKPCPSQWIGGVFNHIDYTNYQRDNIKQKIKKE